MNIVVCIDDTDNIESRGTGKLAQELAESIEKKCWGKCTQVTRHQLFVHEKIPYTSHNSAMCFEVSIDHTRLGGVINYGKEYLHAQSAQGSDPGLCVAVKDEKLNQEKLMQFGRMAKREVLSKESAYSLADELGIHLSEHGGTGDGIIGAMAGTGLRLSGNDGRYRGWYHFGTAGEKISVGTLCAYDFIDAVETVQGRELQHDQRVVLGDEKLKTILRDRRQVVLVDECSIENSLLSPQWRTLSKKEMKIF